MTVNEIIELLDKEENKYGGATGKERELNLSVNGDFIGTITSAKLDDWGDGLVTDVTLEVEVDGIEYLEQEIRAKVIDEFAERLKAESFSGYVTLEDYYEDTVECVSVEDIDEISEQLKAGGKNE